MVTVTPANAHYWYTNQDFDETQAVLSDLQRTPREYLAHADGEVRSLADWTMEYYGLRCLRSVGVDRNTAHRYLDKLYRRLRELASKGGA